MEFNANEFELQNALDNEVRKNRELKYKYESQLDHEINNRQDLEERLNKLKDESIKRENYIIEIE